MNTNDKDKIEQIARLRKEAHGYYLRTSKVYRAFLEMEKATYGDGALDKKTKELIATGVSVAINCESCMEWHIKQALDDGVSPQQIIEAIEVGMEMGGGPATAHARFAMNVLEHYTK